MIMIMDHGLWIMHYGWWTMDHATGLGIGIGDWVGEAWESLEMREEREDVRHTE